MDLSSHHKKRMKQIHNKKQNGTYNEDIDDPFKFFMSSTEMRFVYYKEVDGIEPSNYDMLVL